jgi:hypothetical protein
LIRSTAELLVISLCSTRASPLEIYQKGVFST